MKTTHKKKNILSGRPTSRWMFGREMDGCAPNKPKQNCFYHLAVMKKVVKSSSKPLEMYTKRKQRERETKKKHELNWQVGEGRVGDNNKKTKSVDNLFSCLDILLSIRLALICHDGDDSDDDDDDDDGPNTHPAWFYVVFISSERRKQATISRVSPNSTTKALPLSPSTTRRRRQRGVIGHIRAITVQYNMSNQCHWCRTAWMRLVVI